MRIKRQGYQFFRAWMYSAAQKVGNNAKSRFISIIKKILKRIKVINVNKNNKIVKKMSYYYKSLQNFVEPPFVFDRFSGMRNRTTS